MKNIHRSSLSLHHYQNGISEGQTAVFAYPSDFSAAKVRGLIEVTKGMGKRVMSYEG